MITTDLIEDRLRHPGFRLDSPVIPDCTWAYLEEVLKRRPLGTVWMDRENCDANWVLSEVVDHIAFFRMTRSRLFLDRKVQADRYGIIGMSLVDPTIRDLIITEGVSDFVSVKSVFPDCNVIGFTKLGGTVLARSIAMSIADHIIVCSDNDQMKDRNTGLQNALKMRDGFRSYGIKCEIFLPDTKDVSELLINAIKC